MRQKQTQLEKPEFTEGDLLALVEEAGAQAMPQPGEYSYPELEKKWPGQKYLLRDWLQAQQQAEKVTRRRIGNTWYYRVK